MERVFVCECVSAHLVSHDSYFLEKCLCDELATAVLQPLTSVLTYCGLGTLYSDPSSHLLSDGQFKASLSVITISPEESRETRIGRNYSKLLSRTSYPQNTFKFNPFWLIALQLHTRCSCLLSNVCSCCIWFDWLYWRYTQSGHFIRHNYI